MSAWFWFSKPQRRLALALGVLTLGEALTLGVPSQSAQAQVFFRPFGGVYYGAIEEEPAPYASRRAVARILSEEGFRLVGPLGSRGDQIVALGVDEEGRRMRFLIDPYEGEVLNARRVMGPPPGLPDDVEERVEPPRRRPQTARRVEASPGIDTPRAPVKRASPQVERSRGVATKEEKVQPPPTKIAPRPAEPAPQRAAPAAPAPQRAAPPATSAVAPATTPAPQTTTAVPQTTPPVPQAATPPVASKPPEPRPTAVREEPARAKPAPAPAAQTTSAVVAPAATTAKPATPSILPAVTGNPLLDVTHAEAEKKARKQPPATSQ